MTDATGAAAWQQWLREGLADHAEGLDAADLEVLAQRGDDLVTASLAERTEARYRREFGHFERWCHAVGACPLPASPPVVAAYLVHLARQGTTATPTDDGDESVTASPEGLAPTTMAFVASAVAAVHRNHGCSDPTGHPRVRTLLGGYARRFARAKLQAHGFTLEELGLMAVRCDLPAHESLRDATLLAVATHPLVEVNASQLGRLHWEHVLVPDEPGMPARLDFGTRSGTVWVHPEPDPAICPVRLLVRWHAHTGGNGPVFASPDKPNRPISRQGVVQRLRQLLAGAHLQAHAVLGELPRLTVVDRQRALARLGEPDDFQTRDVAVVALMWWAGLRADEAVHLDVGDVTFRAGKGLIVRVRRSKTDPYGKGAETAVSAQDDYIACAVRRLGRWLERYAEALDRPLQPDDPLFVRLHRGAPGDRLGYDGVNDLVKKWATAAGIVAEPHQRISSHGLRAGQTTTMLHQGRSAEAIARHQRRQDTRHVLDYFRPTDDWAHNPTAGLAGPDTVHGIDDADRWRVPPPSDSTQP